MGLVVLFVGILVISSKYYVEKRKEVAADSEIQSQVNGWTVEIERPGSNQDPVSRPDKNDSSQKKN